MIPVLACLSAISAAAQDVPSFVNSELPGLVNTYKDIHSHPELSHFEARTSGMVAAALREAGYTVTERVGKYPDGAQANGVVGILKNGAGPTLMIRGRDGRAVREPRDDEGPGGANGGRDARVQGLSGKR